MVLVLIGVTALLLFLCWRLIQPFLSPLAWALTLAVVTHPVHRWITSGVHHSGLAAGIAVAVVAVAVVAPSVFVGHSIIREAAGGLKAVQTGTSIKDWREQLAKNPILESTISTLEQNENVQSQFQNLAGELAKRASGLVAGSVVVGVELLLTFFVLFFLFRDRNAAIKRLRSLIPLSEKETDEVFVRVSDTIHATIYGTIVVSAVQGALGGLMFWWLGLPAPMLWGIVMAILALIPILGAFVIWAPAAIFLAVNGEWGKAAILAVWGGVVISLIDNLLYPVLVGKRLRLHTLPVFFAIVGGLATFGAVGLVLGPVILALTDAILEIWRRRTSGGRAAENGVSAGISDTTPREA